ncbi:PHB depolymerase family esterase [Bosea sp. 117]|uniref:alpha/beta hydrolase family esterase n=1 Tax=Bosea sp. 117 TaxID=1125973 RepID=UPI0004944752|nr:PHB depolymerase family esterase [Bosea sp. 117]
MWMLRLILVAALIPFAVAASPAKAQVQRVNIEAGGLMRYYDLYVPPGSGYPLVLVFHGGLGSPDSIRKVSGYEALARSQGFAVAFMAGTGRGNMLVWNAGGCCATAMRSGVDDISYVRAVISQLTATYPIDRRRIYLVGLSNGGMLVQQLAEQLSGQIAAAAVVAGPRFRPVSGGAPVPMMIIHAVGDPVAPFGGGFSNKGMVSNAMSAPFLPVEAGVQGWASRNRCKTNTAQQYQGYQLIEYEGCAGGSRVAFVVVQAGDHDWYGGSRSSGAAVDATAMTWNFMRGFSK